jgi:hypothetical protein
MSDAERLELALDNADRALTQMGVALRARDAAGAKAAQEIARDVLTPLALDDVAPDRVSPLATRLRAATDHVDALEIWQSVQSNAESGSPTLNADREMGDAIRALSRLPRDYENAGAAQALRDDLERFPKGDSAEALNTWFQQAQADWMQEMCADAPVVDTQGSLAAVHAYMAHRAHDPDAMTVSGCSEPEMSPACWLSTCSVTGVDAQGQTHTKTYTFVLGRSEQDRDTHQVFYAE